MPYDEIKGHIEAALAILDEVRTVSEHPTRVRVIATVGYTCNVCGKHIVRTIQEKSS